MGLIKRKNDTVAIYDLGGGTFDVSILQQYVTERVDEKKNAVIQL